MNEEGVRNLSVAVVKLAARDYVWALGVLRRSHDKKSREYLKASYRKNECERFFREDMNLYCDLDGEWLIRELKKRVYSGAHLDIKG